MNQYDDDPVERDEPTEAVLESDPNGDGPAGLSGGMGVSSERTETPDDSEEGTGTRGSAQGRSHGTNETRATPPLPDRWETDPEPPER